MSDFLVRLSVGDGIVVALDGEIDVVTAPIVRRLLDAILTSSPTRLHLDLDGVTFMDTQGITMLLASRRLAEAMGTQLLVRNANGIAAALLGFTSLSRTLEYVPPLLTGCLSN
jgi:anti-sigma B factor antagonist